MSLFQAWCQHTELFWAFVFCRTPRIRTAKAKQWGEKREKIKKRKEEKQGRKDLFSVILILCLSSN